MTSFKTIVSAFLLIVALGMVPGGQAFAQSPLEQVKAAGYVGEQPNGYLGLVSSSAPESAKALAREINLKRRDRYQAIARQNGSSLSAVEMVVGAKLIKRAKPGQYVKGPDGRWTKR